MIIFGTKAKTTTIGEGEFYCPKCQAQRHYQHKKAQRYFTLYFIPLIPMGQLGEFVECQTCHTAFELAVLLMKAPPAAAPSLVQQMNQIGERLKQGTPIEYIIRDLTSAGLERDVAQKTIKAVVGDRTKSCDSCGLTYAAEVTTCTSCGKPLA